nr:MAG TPA: hypothetical protein [Caudoviricetes sp.]
MFMRNDIIILSCYKSSNWHGRQIYTVRQIEPTLDVYEK